MSDNKNDEMGKLFKSRFYVKAELTVTSEILAIQYRLPADKRTGGSKNLYHNICISNLNAIFNPLIQDLP
jgi:hypothetical protein